MFERGKIIKYLLAEDDSLMKKKIIQYYDEPMEKISDVFVDKVEKK